MLGYIVACDTVNFNMITVQMYAPLRLCHCIMRTKKIVVIRWAPPYPVVALFLSIIWNVIHEPLSRTDASQIMKWKIHLFTLLMRIPQVTDTIPIMLDVRGHKASNVFLTCISPCINYKNFLLSSIPPFCCWNDNFLENEIKRTVRTKTIRQHMPAVLKWLAFNTIKNTISHTAIQISSIIKLRNFHWNSSCSVIW